MPAGNPTAINEDKMNAFLGKVVGDFGFQSHWPHVRCGFDFVLHIEFIGP